MSALRSFDDIVLAVLSVVLPVLAAVSPDRIEELIGADPGGGSSFETVILVAAATLFAVFTFRARRLARDPG